MPPIAAPSVAASDLDRSGLVVVRAAVAPVLAEPRVSASQVTQALAGHPLGVLEERGEWLRVVGEDEYQGWVHSGYLERTALPATVADAGVAREDGTAHLVVRWAADRLISLGCVVHTPGIGTRTLPLGAVLHPDETVSEGTAVSVGELPRHFPRSASAAARTAVERFRGTPYQWGGVTPWGADCSGMVQRVFALHGLLLPRDARLQAVEGEDAGSELAALARGDLLFFSDREDGRITHVGVSLGDAGMVHVALGRGGHAIDLLTREEPYAAMLRRNFRCARRVMPEP